jgi:dTDP-4-dehydrorhamnose reductase
MSIELWAGAECTVNRIGDRYADQIARTGHAIREDDLERIAALGVTALRFPVLWERTAPDRPDALDFSWADARMERLRALGIRPIVGLVHHGSGPRYAPIDRDEFVSGLARYARTVAERYPWVLDWTPVNEPLTTARFAGLYGHWYPHGRDTRTFLGLLAREIEATAAAMRAIREVIPSARLVQTEDVGTVRSTLPLAYQASYENQRRWLSFDLLAGTVDHAHPLRKHLETHGIRPGVLDALVDSPCPPDIFGINYYVTSDRFLDHRVEAYPSHARGGNGRHRYADVEAVRACAEGMVGHRAVLETVWDRYRRPVAITEVHLGCTREEQLRWLAEAWRGARAARDAGVDVRALTLWSMFGCVDWASLLTRDEGRYEPGVFDVRGPGPRATALVTLARSIARGEELDHPVLDAPGWWRRSTRFHRFESPMVDAAPGARPIRIVGAGRLSRRIGEACLARGLAFERSALDDRAADGIGTPRGPWAVVAADDMLDEDRWPRAIEAAVRLAAACARHDIPLVLATSDLVFDGGVGRSYRESDAPAPGCSIGRGELELERAAGLAPRALVVRSGPLLDPDDAHDPLSRAVRRLALGRSVQLGDDEIVSPTLLPQLVDATLDLLIDGERGIVHLANPGAVSWHELVGMTAERAGVPTRGMTKASGRTLAHRGRPGHRPLESERVAVLPELGSALDLHFVPRVRCAVDRDARGAA